MKNYDQDPKAANWVGFAWGALAFGLLGLWFRVFELGQQPVLGDEMHAIKSAAGEAVTVTTILAEKGFPDVSIPLALWDYLLLQTVGLSEWGLRLPMLLSGVLFILLLHRFAHRQLGAGCAFATTGLVSISPVLILFSRFARPYMPLTLLSLLALHFWLRHLEGRRQAWMAAVIATVSGAALNPVCIPALGSLAFVAIAWRFRDRRRATQAKEGTESPASPLRSILAVMLIVALIGALTMHQTWQIGLKVTDMVDAVIANDTEIQWHAVGFHLIGTTSETLVLAVAGITAIGACVTWMRARRLALVITVMVVAQVLVIINLIPWGDRTFSIVRYCLVLLPGLLVWTAAGLDATARLIHSKLVRAARGGYVRVGFTSFALLGLLCQGPLPSLFHTHNSFTSIWPTEVDIPPSYGSEERPAWPHFYNALRDYPGEVAIIEAPTVSTNRMSIMPYASYQRIHRRRVLLMNNRSPYKQLGMNLRSTIPGYKKGSVALGEAAILVLHKDFEGERRYMHQIRTSRVADSQRGVERLQSDTEPRWMAADGQLQDRSDDTLQYCLQDETLKTIYEDKWVRAFSRNPEIIAAAKAWKIGS